MTKTSVEQHSFQDYQHAFSTLREIAKRLSQGGPANIDTIVPDVTLANAAFAFCSAHISEIRRLIDGELSRPQEGSLSPDDGEPWNET